MLKRSASFFAFLFGLSFAQDNPSLAWDGYLQAENRVHVDIHSANLTFREYRLDLRAEYAASGKSKLCSELWFRDFGLSDADRIDVQMREAFFQVYGLGFDRLDVTLGRQRTAWGTADRINPTDNIDPYDLEDVWDFGRHLSSDGLRADYYAGKVTLTAVVVPLFRASVLPSGEWKAALAGELREIPGFEVTSMTEETETIGQNVSDNVTAGFRVKTRVFGWDVSGSYVYGRDPLPVPRYFILIPTASDFIADLTDGRLTVAATAFLHYPRRHVAGFDLAGAVGKVGLWAEGAVFFLDKPDNEDLEYFRNPLAQTVPMFEYPSVDPYLKFVLGGDYTFNANWYLNCQFVHGFVHERGDSIENYIMANLDWKLFNEKLKLSPLGIGLEIKQLEDFRENWGFVGQPQAIWYPVDNTELAVGGRVILGKEGTYFGKVKDQDEVFLRAKYSF